MEAIRIQSSLTFDTAPGRDMRPPAAAQRSRSSQGRVQGTATHGPQHAVSLAYDIWWP